VLDLLKLLADLASHETSFVLQTAKMYKIDIGYDMEYYIDDQHTYVS
jgi:hypothetical protein